jgi:Ca2+-binding RTX toxin-like protein
MALITGDDDPDNLLGTAGTDSILGKGGNDTLQGIAGNDQLYGGRDDDLIFGPSTDGGFFGFGGLGHDVFLLRSMSAGVHLDGGSGFDRLRLETFDATAIFLSVANPAAITTLPNGSTLTGIEALEVYGGSGHDSLTGGDHQDTLWGQYGDDLLIGGGGKDNLSGGNGSDSLYGGDGDDLLESYMGAGPDVIDGGTGLDLLRASFGGANVGIVLTVADPGTFQALAGGSTVVGIEQLEVSGSDHDDRITACPAVVAMTRFPTFMARTPCRGAMATTRSKQPSASAPRSWTAVRAATCLF